MSLIPENVVTQEDLNTWFELKKELDRVRVAEMLLRTKIFKFFFQEPQEGTNTVPLSEGWVLKGGYTITRSVDAALLTTLMPSLREKGINPDVLVRWKPDLSTTEYRKLTDVERALFDQVLTIKPGTPSLEIVLPKRQ